MHALRWPARVYIAVVMSTAAVVVLLALAAPLSATFGWTFLPSWMTSVDTGEQFWHALLVLAPVYVLATSLPSPLVVPVAVSVNMPILIAAYLIGGPYASALVAACGLLAYTNIVLLKHCFNAAQFVLVGVLAGFVYLKLGGPLAGDFTSSRFGITVVLPVLVSILVAIVGNALLVFGVLRTAEGLSFRSMWRSVITGSAVPYLGYGLFGLLMAVLWCVGGGFGAALVLLPLLIARWAYSQYAEQQKAYEATIRALVQAVETKDHYTRGHSERVAEGCVRIATVRGLTADRVSALRYAGILHDVGKLSVTTRLLQKTEPLTDLEYEQIKMHPVTGREMLRGITFLEEAYEGILHHHERLDGLGYPMGFKGDEIPEFARVIAVADAFDSMTSTRSYRNARSVEEAIKELQRCRGTQFDPIMVDAMIESLAHRPWRTTGGTFVADEEVRADIERFSRSSVASPILDHDDPTAPMPLGTDDWLRAAAEAAEQPDEVTAQTMSMLRWQDDA